MFDPVYCYTFLFGIGNAKQVCEYFGERTGSKTFEHKVGNFGSAWATMPRRFFMIYVGCNEEDEETVSFDPTDVHHTPIVAHEILHTVGDVMLSKDTPFNNDTHEIYAYYMQYLMDGFYFGINTPKGEGHLPVITWTPIKEN